MLFQTLADCLAKQALCYGNKPYLLFPEKQSQLSYVELFQQCGQLASWLLLQKLQLGDKVAIWLPNIPEFCIAYWGSMCVGAVACPINTLLTGPEVAYIINHSEAKVLVISREYASELARIRDMLTTIQHVLVVDDLPMHQDPIPNSMSFQVIYQSSQPLLPEVLLLPETEAMMIYTSGTTGKPKGVVLTHGNLLTNAHSIATWFRVDDQFRWMNVLPLFHVNGEVVTLMTPLISGGSVVLNRKFSASTFWSTIQEYQVQGVSVVPTILSILLAANTQSEAPIHTNVLEFMICGAAPLPVEVHKQFEATFRVPVFEGYGLSETTCYSTFNPRDLTARRIGSIGVPVDCEVQIWNEQNQLLPVGEEGEIVIAGNHVMKGYYKNPEVNQTAFTGRFFHSGDWGRMDADGFVYILDRVKDMIIRGGENIYPREIDEVLYQHPSIEAAATIGVPDTTYGEAVKSYVVLRSGHHLTEADIIAFCRDHLASFKCPSSIVFVTDIPKGPTGKLLRRALRAYDAPPS